LLYILCNSATYSIAFLPAGNIASIFMVDRLGRRLTACICLAGACVAALGFAAAPADPVWSVVAACVFNAISVGGWNALDLLSAELFPTEVRRSIGF
jgi:MFS family permease